MATVRHALQNDVFKLIDERLMSLVHVYKPSNKKKKSHYLCLTVTKDAPLIYYIHLVKNTEKDTFKRKKFWPLDLLRYVDGHHLEEGTQLANDVEQKTAEFTFVFEKSYKWVAPNTKECHMFLMILYKQCEQIFKNDKPEFKNMPASFSVTFARLHPSFTAIEIDERKLSSKDNSDNCSVASSSGGSLSEKEEGELRQLMAEMNYDASDCQKFIQRLLRYLSQLDTDNMESMLSSSSEQRVQQLMVGLDVAIAQIEGLETRFECYDEILSHVRDTIKGMQLNNERIQTVNSNNEKLMRYLDKLVDDLEVDSAKQATLNDADLATPEGLRQAIDAAKRLQRVMSANIHPTMSKMAAVRDQRKRFEKWKAKFSHTLSRYLNNLFIHLGNDPGGGELRRKSSALCLPVRMSSTHSKLIAYAELMKWCKAMDRAAFDSLLNVYISSMSKLYQRDIAQFLTDAKNRIGGEASAIASLDDDSKSRSSTGGRASIGSEALLLGSERPEGITTRAQKREQLAHYDKILETVLSQLQPVCLTEQKFCVLFFQLDVPTPAKDSSTSESSSQEGSSKKINEEVRKIMGEMFSCVEPQLLNFLSFYEKTDSAYCMSTLVRLSEHVLSAQDTGSFLSVTFGSVLIHAKRNFDRYMQSQLKSIQEFRVPRRSKCGILPFVDNFEDFAGTAEAIYAQTRRRTDLDKWYVRLVAAMFDAIQNIAAECPNKTPPQVVQMENYHHLFAVLSQLKIQTLDAQRKEAKQRYTAALNAYVTRYFGRPLEKLNLFFEGVQAKVAQGVKESEISYQMAFSKQELKKVIKEYPAHEVKKGLENLYKKVDKHLSSEENLLQVVWRAMQEEFIQQFRTIEDMNQRCYPGAMISLEFTVDDILGFFSDIARSH